VLEVPKGISADLVIDNVVGIFSRIFESSWGPRLEDVLRSACLTVLQQDGTPGAGTLVDIPKLLTEPGRHARFMKTGSPEELVGFWKWYDAMSEAQRAQVIGPLIYKLRAFLMRDFVRDIVKERESTVDLGKVLDGGILLVRVPKGILGEDTARLLGSFVVAKTWQAAIARASQGAAERKDASLYVDECQNFLNLPRSFDEILAEARGYKLSLVLAHQHLGQLPRDLRDAVSANARNKVLFTMSPEDAFVLSRHTSPQLTDHDLANLDGYQAAARLVIGGKDQAAFTLRTLAPPPEPRR
ncbi:MAG: type IV secretory system conjugative DNA transfer family protein, partial [Pseudonocardiaceae bacterium]